MQIPAPASLTGSQVFHSLKSEVNPIAKQASVPQQCSAVPRMAEAARDDGLFVPVDAASLEQLVQVTTVMTELTRMLVAPLGLSAAVQLMDDQKLDAAVRDRLAIGNMAAVELACESVGISPGAHALAAANHEKAPEMRKLLRAQEELIQKIFEPARVVELPANARPEVLLRAVRAMEYELRESMCGPFDGAQARKLLELTQRTCRNYGWTHEQLQALAEGYSSEAEVFPLLTSAWDTWAAIVPHSPTGADEDVDEADSEMADAWMQCQEDVEAAADALGAGRVLEARELLSYALETWEQYPLSALRKTGNGVPLSAARATAKEYIVQGYCLRADCAAFEAEDECVKATFVLCANSRADLEAALALDPGCSAAHFRLARSTLASVAPDDSNSNSNTNNDCGGASVDEAVAARKARLSRLEANSEQVPATADAENATAVNPSMAASEGLFHAVSAVVIGSEQLPELIQLVGMVEALSKAAGKEAAAGLWTKKDPRGLPPSWVLASYFDSFGRWLLKPAAAEPPSGPELQAIAEGKRATVAVSIGRSEFSRASLSISTVDAESATVVDWRRRLTVVASHCNAQEYNAAEAALIALVDDVLAHPEVTARLNDSSSAVTPGAVPGPTGSRRHAAVNTDIVGRRAWAVAAALLAGRAAFLYMEARYASAAELLNKAVKLEPDNPLWLCQRATVWFDMGRTSLAHSDLDAALALDRRCAPAYLQRGHIQLFHGDKAKAVPELRYSLAIDDELPLAHVELAIALQAGGKADQALVVVEKAAERFPESVELLCFYAEMTGAAGNLVKAMALFREIVDTVPTCPLPYLHAALLLASLGDVPSALRHLDAACKLCEDGTESESFDAGHVELGTMLMARDDAERAAHHFDVAFRTARSLPELEVAATAKELAAAQQRVATTLDLPISQVAERLIATQSEIQMMQMQGGGAY